MTHQFLHQMGSIHQITVMIVGVTVFRIETQLLLKLHFHGGGRGGSFLVREFFHGETSGGDVGESLGKPIFWQSFLHSVGIKTNTVLIHF